MLSEVAVYEWAQRETEGCQYIRNKKMSEHVNMVEECSLCHTVTDLMCAKYTRVQLEGHSVYFGKKNHDISFAVLSQIGCLSLQDTWMTLHIQ